MPENLQLAQFTKQRESLLVDVTNAVTLEDPAKKKKTLTFIRTLTFTFTFTSENKLYLNEYK